MANKESDIGDELATAEESVDKAPDTALRPKVLGDFIGQPDIKANLHTAITAARGREESLEHILLAGPAGLGKTTLAGIIGSEMGLPVRITSGPALERAGDIASILTSLQPGEILFIDEIHRLNRTVEELLYPAIEDFALDLVVGKGPGARTMRLNLPNFTLIGATTKPGSLSAPLRDRFGIHFQLDYYSDADIAKIILRSAKLLGIEVTPAAAEVIAKRSRRTPRVANRLVKRVRDYATINNALPVTPEIAEKALDELGIDKLGLDTTDRRILHTIVKQFHSGPVGVAAVSAATAIEQETLEDVYEPYLLQIGFIDRTLRGRVVTDAGVSHLLSA